MIGLPTRKQTYNPPIFTMEFHSHSTVKQATEENIFRNEYRACVPYSPMTI
jgi:hypothetical protein